MVRVSTHVLDVSVGRVASDVEVILEVEEQEEGGGVVVSGYREVGRARTNEDGRIREWGCEGEGEAVADNTVFRLTFLTGPYFEGMECDSFYPYVQLVFRVRDGKQHYHVPLLLSPFGYSTYRGS